jgi:prophage antirepressor-like protein
MNKLQIFNYQEKEVRTVMIDNELWFVASDVCEILEISNHRDAILRLSESMKGVATTDTLGGNQEMRVISEAGVYKLVFTSRKPEAEKFTDWLASEVIPSIRKTGGYSKQMTMTEIIAASAQQLVEVERLASAAFKLADNLDSKITNVIDVFTAPTADNWKHDMSSKINQIVESQGFSHQKFRGDLYEELECLAHCDITARQSNLRKRMKLHGATYKDCAAATKLDVVDRDAPLKVIFEGIVRKYQVKFV